MTDDRDRSKDKILVCSAWPYASGVPHLGNLQTSLLSGGVFTRYYELRGHDVVHVSGSDAHGTRIEFEAEKQGTTPEELSHRIHNKIVQILDEFDIRIHNYTITTNKLHSDFVQEIYNGMEANGYITTKEEERAYCHNCQKFLADRFIEGTCPRCDSDGAHGNQCDECGALLEPEDLHNPRCAICGSDELEFKATRHWYLDLPQLDQELRDYIGTHFDDWQRNVKNFTENMLQEGLQPRAVTRDIKWGIPAPFNGAEQKVIYVWAEAALGYVSATIEYFQNKGDDERWEDFWFGEDVKQIYTHAKDNIPFHTIIFPAQLIASDRDYHLPDQISASEYLNWIGGESFSKSKGRGLYCDEATDLLDSVFWRFFLLYYRPEKRDVEFSWKELDKAVNGIFVDNVSNFVNRVTSIVYSKSGGEVPPGEVLPEVSEKIEAARSSVERHVENGSLSSALREACDLANFGNQFFQNRKPWKNDDPDVLTSGLQLVKSLSIMLEPFVPSFSQQVYDILGLQESSWDRVTEPVEGSISEPEALLQKPDIDQISSQYEQMKNTENNKKEEDIVVDNQLPIDEFSKLDIRIGLIEEVEPISGADRLYRIEVDVGDNQLTTVSGIKKHYDPDELRGERAVAVTNLESATIHGVTSECMLLAATDDVVSLIQPDQAVEPGTKVE